jgi:hypothetical protein
MENKEVVLKKIPLKIFLDVLTDAYNKGADFVDIIGIADEIQDNVGIAIREEYISKDDIDELDIEVEFEEEDDDNDELTDNDLNQLI